MPRFEKQADCITSATLAAHGAGALSPLARLAAGPHLRSCDFCAAELRLHERAADARAATTTPEPPPMPLALRLYAKSKLAESASAVARRAA